ncbi:MAG: N-acetylmuramoyl-L-alanine amidase family 2 [Planctomycetota bacterium]|nr:MAG: N-acetylmuramoyl-L-alanine amidase family 2 [Planctomycetota bacterium]
MIRLVAGFVLAQAIFIAGVLALRAPSGALVPDPDPSASWEPRVPVRNAWTHVIIHHSASGTGSAAQFDREHRAKGWDSLGYHFVIGNGSLTEDGRVEAGSRWLDQADGAHAKPEWNARAVGVCLVGNFETADPTPAQLRSLEHLCRWLGSRCGIPPANFVGHGGTHGNATLCPGKRLDLELLRRNLASPR